jgi:cytochrome c553
MSNHKPESTSSTPTRKSLAQRSLSFLMGLGAVAAITLPLLGSSSAQMDAMAPKPDAKMEMPKGDAAKGGTLYSERCQGCHGANGNSTNPNRPKLAGQIPSYLGTQLFILKQGIRPSPVMNGIAAKLSDADMANLVAFLSAQKPTKTFASNDAKLAAEGKKLFLEGRPKDGVMACAICHGSSGEGYMSGGAPRIANQSPLYVVKIVAEFKNGPIAESSHYTAMKVAATPLTDADVKAVVEYLASLE